MGQPQFEGLIDHIFPIIELPYGTSCGDPFCIKIDLGRKMAWRVYININNGNSLPFLFAWKMCAYLYYIKVMEYKKLKWKESNAPSA